MLAILNYNENKVNEGVAKCILENGYGCPVSKLTFGDKVNGLDSFVKLNRRATTKAVHVSLNFHPDEKLNQDTLQSIASSYMDKIGFGSQPYLVYQHFDAGHPHLHIVTTNIQRSGKRIVMYNIGKNQSEKARKQIEKEFGLIKASGRTQNTSRQKTNNLKVVTYGRSETKGAISNVVRTVIESYRYTSLPELNAALKQYNVMADRGGEKSVMFSKGGLHYRIIDDKGNKIGVPIKASSIYTKPTLSYLTKQFKLNEALRSPHKTRLKNCIDNSVGGRQSITMTKFIEALNAQNISVVIRQNDEGRIFGLTFVDNLTKVVFNGSDLGKRYGAKSIMERLTSGSKAIPIAKQFESQTMSDYQGKVDLGLEKMVDDLVSAESYDFTSPDAALRKRRKKKRKGRSL